MIPGKVKEQLRHYATCRAPVPLGIRIVLENMENPQFPRPDRDWTTYIKNLLPPSSYGTKEKVARWLTL